MKNLYAIKAIPIMKAKTIKNEIPDVILMMTERYSNRLKLSIINGRYIGCISERDRLQNRIFMEAYVREKGRSSYDQIENIKKIEPVFDKNNALLNERSSRNKAS